MKPALVKIEDLKEGDIILPDTGFDCLLEREECVVHKDPQEGLFVFCKTAHGEPQRHWLDGQEGYTLETEGFYVGFWKKGEEPTA